MITLADFILVSGFAITSVMLFLLGVLKKKKMPQKILMAFLAIILLIIITISASVHHVRSVFVVTNLFEDGARFVLGPLLYIYIKSIFDRDKGLVQKNLVHFIPFFLYWSFFSLPRMMGRINEDIVFDYMEFFQGTPYLAIIKDVFLLFYIFLSIRLFLKYKTKIGLNYSSFKGIDFIWLKKFLVGFILVTLFDLAVIGYLITFRPNIAWDLGLVSLCFLILATIYLSYQGLRQSTIYLPDFLIAQENVKLREVQSAKPLFSEKEIIELNKAMEKVLREEKPYLLQEITLNGLAERIGTTDKKLSMFLNHTLNISFYDFINRYRVEAVKEKLESEEFKKYTLLGIAYSCGFNSKSSFYRAFKKETGSSPISYKKEMASEKCPTISNDTLV